MRLASRQAIQIASLLMVVIGFCSFEPSIAVSQEMQRAEPATKELNSPLSWEAFESKFRQRAIEKWQADIDRLVAKNEIESWPDDSLLFFGSSSFRRWDSMQADMKPYSAINRGYGGAKYVDMAFFAKQILTRHQYKALMLFAANDVKGDIIDSNPEEVEIAVRTIIKVSRAHEPNAAIFIVEVTPTESRFKVWDRTRLVNATLRELALSTPNVWYIATADHYLKADGSVNSEYFVDDKLHLNAEGYRRWAELIKRKLNTFLPTALRETDSVH